jgi:hypothetical protein
MEFDSISHLPEVLNFSILNFPILVLSGAEAFQSRNFPLISTQNQISGECRVKTDARGIGVIFGLIPLTLFEIGQLGLMIWAINNIGRRNSPDSIFTAELHA